MEEKTRITEQQSKMDQWSSELASRSGRKGAQASDEASIQVMKRKAMEPRRTGIFE